MHPVADSAATEKGSVFQIVLVVGLAVEGHAADITVVCTNAGCLDGKCLMLRQMQAQASRLSMSSSTIMEPALKTLRTLRILVNLSIISQVNAF